jgi:hypothetical protein
MLAGRLLLLLLAVHLPLLQVIGVGAAVSVRC